MITLALITCLADTTAQLPDPKSSVSIGWFVAAAAASALAYREITTFIRGAAGKGEPREISNDPLNVRLTGHYATREEVDRIDSDVRNLTRRIDDLPKALGDASEERLTRVHSRIDELQKEIAAMPHQIVALLRNSKNL